MAKQWLESTVTAKYGFEYCPTCTEYFDRDIPDRRGHPACWGNDLDKAEAGYTRHLRARIKRTDTRPVRLNRTYTAKPI